MFSRVLRSAGMLAYGAAAGWLLGLPLALLAIAVPVAGGHVYRYYVWPRRTHQMLRAHLDPSAGPPAGAEPVVSEWPQLLEDLSRARRWDELDALLAADFTRLYLGGTRHDRARYLASLRRRADEFSTRDQSTFARPDEPEILWVRSKNRVSPRHARPWEFTQWTRYTFAPDNGRLRELANVAVVDVT